MLKALRPRILIFDEFHNALRGRARDVDAIFAFLRRLGLEYDVSPALIGEVAVYDRVNATPELLSSWLHRLALAHGLSPRHFGEGLGFGSGAWSARLDLALPGTVLSLLHHQTDVDRDRIMAMTIGAKKWRPLLLPLRRAQADQKQATWQQFCAVCLAEDETPYFRREWRRASVMTCRRHRRGLLDRCPACRQGLAPFNQRALVSQHRCAVCGFDLRQAKAPILTRATRKAAELIDDLNRLEAAKGFLEKSTLIKRIIALPSLQEPPSNEKFTGLSTAERIRCVARVGNCFDQRFDRLFCVEPDAVIAAWRRTIVAAGGITASTQPLLRRLTSRAPLENEWKPRSRNHKDGAGAANLHSLLAAYGAVGARRELRMRGDSSFYASSVVSSSSAPSNFLSKTSPSSSTSPKAPSRSMSDQGRRGKPSSSRRSRSGRSRSVASPKTSRNFFVVT